MAENWIFATSRATPRVPPRYQVFFTISGKNCEISGNFRFWTTEISMKFPEISKLENFNSEISEHYCEGDAFISRESRFCVTH